MPGGSDLLDVIFNKGRTYDSFLEKAVPESLLQEAYDLAKMPPTSANCQPMRIVFLTSQDAKDRLAPALSSTNKEKTLKAPAVAIIAHDLAFFENMESEEILNPTQMQIGVFGNIFFINAALYAYGKGSFGFLCVCDGMINQSSVLAAFATASMSFSCPIVGGLNLPNVKYTLFIVVYLH